MPQKSSLKSIFKFFNLFGLIFLGLIFCLNLSNANVLANEKPIITNQTKQSLNLTAQTADDLNVLGTKCFFSGQPGCSGDGILENLIKIAKNFGTVLATLVIIWGGYKYFFSGLIDGQEDGLKAISAGVTGLLVIQIAPALVEIVKGSYTSEGFTFNPLALQINNIVDKFLIPLAGIVAVLVVIWGGYQYMFSGLPEGQKDGMENIQKGVTGLIIVLISKPIVNAVKGTFGSSSDGNITFNLDNGANVLTFLKAVLVNFLIPVASVVALFFLVLGTYYMTTSNGNEETYKKGLSGITSSLIGLAVVLLATTIVQLIIVFVPSLSL
jgi:type IV secretory pathway VirB2 component (pilin)